MRYRVKLHLCWLHYKDLMDRGIGDSLMWYKLAPGDPQRLTCDEKECMRESEYLGIVYILARGKELKIRPWQRIIRPKVKQK
jgi:hypothetical protein